jgi:hypothetical protein
MSTPTIPPYCPSCRSAVTLMCPNFKEALIVCSNEDVRVGPDRAHHCTSLTPTLARAVPLAVGRD